MKTKLIHVYISVMLYGCKLMSRVYKYIFNESRILRRLVCHSNDTDTIANWL